MNGCLEAFEERQEQKGEEETRERETKEQVER